MNVLVTGGGGFVGSRIVGLLLERGYAVAILGRFAQQNSAPRGVEVIRADLADAEAVARACAGRDGVFHVAARAGVWGPRREYWSTNVEGTRNVIAACRRNGVPRLVYTSTPSVVFSGEAFEGVGESIPYGRNWLCHYAETKAIAEQEVLAAHSPGKLAVCALRPHLVWGVGDPHLLPRVIAKARSGRLRQVGDGNCRVDLTHVANAARAHLDAWDALERGTAGGGAYFISNGEPVALWPWINDLLRRLEIPPVRKRIPLSAAYRLGALMEHTWRWARLPGEPPMTRFVAVELAKSHWFSIDAARRDLGYEPRTSMEEGLREYVAWWKAEGWKA